MGYLVKPSSGLELKQIITTLDNSEISQLDSNFISIGSVEGTFKIISIQMSVDDDVNAFGDFYIVSGSSGIEIANFTNNGVSLTNNYVAHFSLGAFPQLTISGYEIAYVDTLFIKTINQPITSATQMKVVLSYFE
jgi:hypothetical protein